MATARGDALDWGRIVIKLILKTLPWIASAALSLATALAAGYLRSSEAASLGELADAAAQGVRGEMLVRYDARMLPLVRMARRWVNEVPAQPVWEFEAGMIFADYPGFQSIQWMDPQHHVRWRVPQQGTEKAQDLFVPFEERRKEALERSIATRRIQITRPIDLTIGGRGFLAFSPIFVREEFKGCILGVFRADRLFDSILSEISQARSFSVEILHDGEVFYTRGAGDPGEARNYERSLPLERQGVSWTLRLRPTAAFLEGRHSPLPQMTLILGQILAILVGLTLFFAGRARERARRAERVETELRETQSVLERRVQERTLEIRTLNSSLENRVAARTAELQAAVAELEAFGYTVSHDLRAPLRAISGFSLLVRSEGAEGLSPEARDHLERIDLASQRMDAMIRDLLNYSRISRAKPELVPVDADALLREILDQLSSEIQERHADVAVEGKLPCVMGDRVLLNPVLTNLISNAIKFVPADRAPRVRLRGEQHDSVVRLWIEDNGIGIDPDHQARIFGVFERLHRQEDFPGTGIGLAIVRRALDRMGGRVGVESVKGQGSRFWIELPHAC